jgi:hypothetical protein
MKKIPISIAILIATLFFTNSLHAQFLKKIINSVKQSTQNKASDKADSSVQSKLTSGNSSSSGDTVSTNKVLRAFAKAGADNPNDTSASDLTMKALGNLMGGGGVSKADSVAAIKSFTSAKGGTGMFYQYITTISSKQMGTHNDTTSTYFSSNGEGRSEMNLAGMMGVKGGNKLIIISHANQPQYSLTLDANDKTYSLNVIDTSLINSSMENYQVTKVGNEIVQGFNCTHAKLTSTSGKGAFKSSSTFDIWTSADVQGYALLKKFMTMKNITPKMMQALNQAGCGGFFVKMTSQNKDFSMNMTLMKTQEKNFPSSLFSIPAGYTESKENMMFHMATKK